MRRDLLPTIPFAEPRCTQTFATGEIQNAFIAKPAM
jgi:hypothetical protein